MAGHSDATEPDKPLAGRPRRQPPTIELTAKEVPGSPEPQQPPQDADEPSEPAQSGTPGASIAPEAVEPAKPAPAEAHANEAAPASAPEAEAVARTEPPAEPDRLPPPPDDNRPRPAQAPASPAAWSLVAASAAGAVLMTAVFFGLWVSGAFAPSGNADSVARLTAVEAQLRQIAAKPPEPVRDVPLDVLQRLAAVEQNAGAMRPIEQRLAQLESAGRADNPTLATDTALQSRVASVEDTLKRLQTQVPELQTMQSRLTDLQTLQSQITELRSAMDETATLARNARQGAVAAAAAARAPDSVSRAEFDQLAARLSQFEQTAKDLQDKVSTAAQPTTVDQRLRAAVVSDALRSAVVRGAPFAAELSAAKPFLSDAAALATLEPLADTGLPSLPDLQQEFARIESAIVNAAAPATQDGSLLGRLQANAERLVRVRPIGARAGDDVPAMVARVSAELNRGDLAAAIAEADKLPPESQRIAAEWLTKATTRRAAIQAARNLSVDALSAIGKPAP